jgi:hypothetical protein
MTALQRLRIAKVHQDMRATQRAQEEAQNASAPVVDGKPCDTCPPDDADTPVSLQSPAATVVPDEPITASATAVRNAIVWPADHFEKWRSATYEPLTVHPDGQITGHLAGDGCFQNGDASVCVKYKRDVDPTLARFNTWTTTLDDGNVIRTGALTAGGPHAPVMEATKQGWKDADIRRFHEDTSTVFARVVAWEDEKGRLAVAGSIIPELDPMFVRQAAGAPVSIEKMPMHETGWRNTLVGAHMVVTPALPVVTG